MQVQYLTISRRAKEAMQHDPTAGLAHIAL